MYVNRATAKVFEVTVIDSEKQMSFVSITPPADFAKRELPWMVNPVTRKKIGWTEYKNRLFLPVGKANKAEATA